MTAIYSIEFKVNKENKANFDKAFSHIFELSKMLCNSKNKKVMEFIQDPVEPSQNWLEIDSEKHEVTTITERGYININQNDASEQTEIKYNFGKRAPAEDGYILAVIAIIYHYFPDAILHDDIKEDDFDDGVYLARIVNFEIENPLNKGKEPRPSENIKNIFSALKEKEEIQPARQPKKHKIIAEDSPILAKKNKLEEKCCDSEKRSDEESNSYDEILHSSFVRTRSE